MTRRTPAALAVTLTAALMLPSCMDRFVSLTIPDHTTVDLVERDGQKIAVLGEPGLRAGRCAMLGESSYVFKPNGEAEFQGVTTAWQPGETWRQTVRLLSGGWTTLFELTGLSQQMDQANQRLTWPVQRFRYPPSLYPALGKVEFHGEC
jgi:hypothetical protein